MHLYLVQGQSPQSWVPGLLYIYIHFTVPDNLTCYTLKLSIMENISTANARLLGLVCFLSGKYHLHLYRKEKFIMHFYLMKYLP